MLLSDKILRSIYIFFSDDDKYDLKTMYEREKLSTAEDQNGMLSRYGNNLIFFLPTLISASFFNILKKTQGPKNSKLKKKLNNSRKKLKVWASFKEIVLIRLNFSNKHPSLGCFSKEKL